jgi:hypothetical protein
MNKQIKLLGDQARTYYPGTKLSGEYWVFDEQKFAELIKQAIYDQVKDELIPDELIAKEPPEWQQYLRGCNAGTVDALTHIKNFGVDIEL